MSLTLWKYGNVYVYGHLENCSVMCMDNVVNKFKSSGELFGAILVYQNLGFIIGQTKILYFHDLWIFWHSDPIISKNVRNALKHFWKHDINKCEPPYVEHVGKMCTLFSFLCFPETSWLHRVWKRRAPNTDEACLNKIFETHGHEVNLDQKDMKWTWNEMDMTWKWNEMPTSWARS